MIHPIPFIRKHTPLRGIAISKNDLISLYSLLQSNAQEAARIELQDYKKREDQTQDEFEKTIAQITDLFSVYVKLETEGRTTLSQASAEIFSETDRKGMPSRIEFDSGHHYRDILKREPDNQIFLILDFRNVSSLGFNVQPGQATPNDSQFAVVGTNSTWVHSAHSQIEEFFKSRHRKGTVIHEAGFYDFLLMTIGILFIAWTLDLSTPYIDHVLEGKTKTILYASYIFVFLASLKFFSFMFDYARRMWPLAELKGANSVTIAHRVIWIGIFASVIAGLINDIFL